VVADPPGADVPDGQAARIATGFAHALRAAGMAVPSGRVLVFVEALGLLGIDSRDAVYWAGRATLTAGPDDRPTYDRVFAAYWLGSTVSAANTVTPVTVALDEEAPEPDQAPPEAVEESEIAVRYSPAEILRHRDFAQMSEEEWAEAERLIAELRVSAETRRARRRRPARRRGGQLDLRATIRRSIPAGGEQLLLSWRSSSTRPRNLLLLVDVSGSMDSYARALLRFGHAAMRARGRLRVQVFALGTRLTALTRELSNGDADAALAAAARSVPDWSGGTRLGLCLQEFNDRWGARGMARGAVTVVFSDGWDRGDPALLGAEMARLHRLARRVIWVNPLKASPDFMPLARGMAAALPWLDHFLSGHSIAALEELAAVISGASKP
jgi:uncharacterized protein with von Willebrand factor type A (vWA) domain